MTPKENIDAIAKTYHLIDDNFDAIYTHCDTAQRIKLIACRDSARDTFWNAIAKDLRDNHQLVEDTLANLKVVNDKIETDLKNLKNISALLQLLTEGIKLAASLATLAAA